MSSLKNLKRADMKENKKTQKIKVWIPMYSFYSYFGGSEKQAEKLSVELSRLGIDITIITAKTKDGQKAQKKIPDEFSVRLLPYLYSGENKILRKISSFVFMIELFFYLLLNSNKYDILKAFFIDKYTLMTVFASLINKKPVIMLEQNLKKYENPGLDLKNDSLHQALYGFYKKASALVAISDEIREEFIQTFDVPEDIIFSIPNGVEKIEYQDKISAREKTGLPMDKIICLMIGRLSYQKNHIQIFKAWKVIKEKNPDLVLYCLGEGEKRAELEDFIMENGCENNIILAGTKNNVHDYYNAADIFVLPSHFEGMPNVLIEAMSAGKPIVASRIKAHTPIIEHNHSGILFDLSVSDEELADIVIGFIRNPELMAKTAQNAKIKAEEFDIKNIAGRYVKLYETLLGAVSGGSIEE